MRPSSETLSQPRPAPPVSAVPPLAGTPWKLTTRDFMKLAEVGILHEDDPVELLDGELITMSPIGFHHAAIVDRLSDWLHDSLRKRAIIRVQTTIVLEDHSAPEPDLAILNYREDYYASGHPRTADILWIIEVADTSVAYDAGPKKRAYAAAGIAEYWVIDLGTPALLVFRDPQHGQYQSQQSVPEAQSIGPLAFPDIRTTLRRILGRD